MPRFLNILAAADFSPASEDAVAIAADLSRSDHGRLHLLHVVPSVQVPYTMEPVVFDFSDFVRQSVDRAHRQFAALAARHRIDHERLTTAVVNGPPAAEILRYAKDHAIDLLVLGAHGHGVIDRLLIGSVADRVARHAPCAVLLVPPVTRGPATVESQAAAGAGA
jgi:nucleotide-binding universal stress UspA family protein